jgi:LysR family hydrogen peroxide-inducible transcriptional activator
MTELGDFRASSLSTLVQMVATGAGITLLPESAVAVELRGSSDLVAVPFRSSGPGPNRTLGLAWRPTSPRGEEFTRLAAALAGGPTRPER